MMQTTRSTAADTSAALDFAAALPAGLVYMPEFLSRGEESALLREVQALPLHEAEYKQYTARRRVASFGSTFDYDRNALDAATAFPPFMVALRDKIATWTGVPADDFVQGLVSEYRPGTPLGWHRDVPQFETVVGVSLLASCRMRFRPYPPRNLRRSDIFVLELQPRSAYVFQGDIRWRWQHSVAPTKALRYSITLRTLSAAGKNGAAYPA